MGCDRAAPAEAQAAGETARWPAADPGSAGPDRHSLCVAPRFAVGCAAEGTRLRFRSELLAAVGGLAGGGGVGAGMAGPARSAPPRRAPAMGTGRAGWVRRPGAKRGPQTGRNPTDRGKIGTKHHLVVDQQGIPLATTLSAANTHDSKMMVATLDAIPAVRGRRGRPRRRPTKAHLDKGYDYPQCRRALRRRGIESSQRLGRYRWVVERSFAWLHAFRRLRAVTSAAQTCITLSSPSAASSSAPASFIGSFEMSS